MSLSTHRVNSVLTSTKDLETRLVELVGSTAKKGERKRKKERERERERERRRERKGEGGG